MDRVKILALIFLLRCVIVAFLATPCFIRMRHGEPIFSGTDVIKMRSLRDYFHKIEDTQGDKEFL